jgi:hypothetical protein
MLNPTAVLMTARFSAARILVTAHPVLHRKQGKEHAEQHLLQEHRQSAQQSALERRSALSAGGPHLR